MRRRRLATKWSAALTVSFLVVVPSSLAASAKSSSFRSIIVFILPSLLPWTHHRQYQVGFTAAPVDRRRRRAAGRALRLTGLVMEGTVRDPSVLSPAPGTTVRRRLPSPSPSPRSSA